MRLLASLFHSRGRVAVLVVARGVVERVNDWQLASFITAGKQTRDSSRLMWIALDLRDARAGLDTALDSLRSISEETCDHGPGFCPREAAKATLAAMGVAL